MLWENGYIESFNRKLRDELFNGEIFDTILETKVLIEIWQKHYNNTDHMAHYFFRLRYRR